MMGLRLTRPVALSARRMLHRQNYLDGENSGALNRIVNAYIEFGRAEGATAQGDHAGLDRKLDDFHKTLRHDLLDHAGKISMSEAKIRKELEYESYQIVG
jgi:hypothetical protein